MINLKSTGLKLKYIKGKHILELISIDWNDNAIEYNRLIFAITIEFIYSNNIGKDHSYSECTLSAMMRALLRHLLFVDCVEITSHIYDNTKELSYVHNW